MPSCLWLPWRVPYHLMRVISAPLGTGAPLSCLSTGLLETRVKPHTMSPDQGLALGMSGLSVPPHSYISPVSHPTCICDRARMK